MSQLRGTLVGLSTVLKSWAVSMRKCAKGIWGNSRPAQEKDFSGIDFQAAAFTVCKELHTVLSRTCDSEEIYITVFQRIREDGSDVCSMIAYSTIDEPNSYGDKYDIAAAQGKEFGTVEFHTYYFASGHKEIKAFVNAEEVKKAFVEHSCSSEREENIQQYICVPISPAKKGATFLIQIDTSIPGLFGKDTKSAVKFAKESIHPYAQFLHLVYEENRTIEQVRKCIGGKYDKV